LIKQTPVEHSLVPATLTLWFPNPRNIGSDSSAGTHGFPTSASTSSRRASSASSPHALVSISAIAVMQALNRRMQAELPLARN
jgi:hypothetical protein